MSKVTLYSLQKVYGFKSFENTEGLLLRCKIVMGNAVLEGRTAVERVAWLFKLVTKDLVAIKGGEVVVHVNERIMHFSLSWLLVDEETSNLFVFLAMFNYYLNVFRHLRGKVSEVLYVRCLENVNVLKQKFNTHSRLL